jgi:hypothetical protein
MNIHGYDEWKLSNPFDDGHYTEDETTSIVEALTYKYRNHNSWTYGMITPDGYDIRVHRYSGSPSIDVNEIHPTMEELDDTIDSIKRHYKDYTEIDYEEFEEQYKEARQIIDRIVAL